MFATTPRWAAALCSLSLLALARPASAQVPDVTTYDIGYDGPNTNDIHYWGQSGGIAAYSIATQSCNSGTMPVDWHVNGGSTLHPVIGQNMFRYKDGRFEQIGQSWLKHGFCAVNEDEALCMPCSDTPCDTLGVGCADTYWATLNDGQGGQSKVNVNGATGAHTHGGAPSGPAAIRGRLQVALADIDPAQNPGAEYFIEGHYVNKHDADHGRDGNNASWRRVVVNSVTSIVGGGNTDRGNPAIYAWQEEDHQVEIDLVVNLEEQGRSNYYVGYRVTQIGQSLWHYEYAIQNLNSHQSVGSFTVPAPPSVTIENASIGFHDVNYHSGDPYDGTDWPGVRNAGDVTWATTPFSTNPNANALRWGTLYNFRFDANAAPVNGNVTMGMFRPTFASSLAANNVLVPGEPDIWNGNPTETAKPNSKTFGNPRPPAPPPSIPEAASRNGSGRNVGGFYERAPAVIGHEWHAGLDLRGAERSVIFIGMGGTTEGTFNDMGEVLVRPPLLRSKPGTLSLEIPDDARLIGVTFSAQAAIKTADGWKLTNALDVTIGSD